jgi:hypothetical protein
VCAICVQRAHTCITPMSKSWSVRSSGAGKDRGWSVFR